MPAKIQEQPVLDITHSTVGVLYYGSLHSFTKVESTLNLALFILHALCAGAIFLRPVSPFRNGIGTTWMKPKQNYIPSGLIEIITPSGTLPVIRPCEMVRHLL
jgi:hypothetical protein